MASLIPKDYRGNKTLVVGGAALAVGVSTATAVWAIHRWNRRGDGGDSASEPPTAHEQLIEGGTPLIELKRVKKLIGRSVYEKWKNPGGTGKDRAALNMIRMAEKEGNLPPPVATISIKDDDDG
eukprot:CAMPEP_0116130090 /NCGR_PEP_ID=MMETSP0329-20121206/8270_1 /TAXON_ID=697910 /ORGANISM="Pseudo-nitzschia arenysensis, Strain B593" /LENGTH=123 /DNA_ID=CAMNT_0003624397 /DNA_START=81 /DNA_END=450 /DNA_ORIENTATION=+